MRDGIERERLYDRFFGKVPDRSINLNLNLDASPDQLTTRALELLQRVSPDEVEELQAVEAEDISDLIDE